MQSHTLVGELQDFNSANSDISHLVGEYPEGEVDLGGFVVTCLLDTGSMVTTIAESSFKEKFSHQNNGKLKDCGWLGLKAANGLKIPYLGYIELDITILGNCLPARGVLIVEDSSDGYMKQKKTSVPGVLGMNVFNPLYCEL